MTQTSSIISDVSGRYAKALFDLAKEARSIDAVAADLGELSAALAQSDALSRLIASPVLSRAQAAQAIAGVARTLGLGDLVSRFLGVLARNRRLADLPGAIQGFTALAAAHRGEATAQVTSAFPLTDKQTQALRKKLKAGLGSDVFIDAKVDPALLGGIVVKVGSRMIDSSLKSKLEQLSLAMKG